MNRIAAVVLSLVALPLASWADPPGRVARVSLVEGEAAVFTDPGQGWEPARINAPLTSENSVWTEPGARVEVRFGSTSLRLGEATQLDVLRLDDESLSAHVPRGMLNVRIRELDRNETYEVTTTLARFQLRGSGRYRVDADGDHSRLTVFSGNARLETAGGYISIDTGRAIRVTGGERPRYEFETAAATALDDWALARDQRFEQREASRYLPPQMTGWEDLDDYGVWRQESDYGAVWFPTRVEPGWAPYRHGRWTWVRPWGWSWVDDAPWGYAPFHYGRWIIVGNRWGWYPGRYTTRPVWAPALVGWVGRPGWSISISSGLADVVGWYPLSPHDRYQPWYSANATYVNNVNRIVIPPRRDHDRRDDRRDSRRDERFDNREHGATVMPREHFGDRRPVQNFRANVPRDVVAAQPVVSGSAVLPARGDWRARTPAADLAQPVAGQRRPAGGESVSNPRHGSPLAPAPGAPSTRPMATTPAVPAYPSAPAAPPARFARPVPAEPAARVKPEASDRTMPPASRTKPAELRRGDPAPPRAVERPAPRAVESPAPRAVEKPAPRAVEKPAPAQSESRPAPAPREKPSREPERSPRPAEKPAKPDHGDGG